jgi:hypothetical protein
MRMSQSFPKLEFAPIFYVLDYGRYRVLAARKIDKYEVKGMYFEWDAKSGKWESYHASLNNQAFNEYADRFDLTKKESAAVKFAVSTASLPKLSEEQCNHKYTTHYYIS